MENKKYTVAIDLGESNIVVAVGSKTQDAQIKVEGIVSLPCEGVKAGTIDNIALVEESIKKAVSQIENQLNIRVLEAYAGISGEFVRFACHSDHVYVSDQQNGVSQADVNALFDRMRHVQAPDNETIMERIPQNYVVDDAKEVKNPVGSFGRRLSSTYNFILCANTPMQRLENALRRVGINMLQCYPNALSMADSVLSSEEKEEGVAVVNLGGGLTDVTIYYRNVVRYIVTIPMGASAINRDIRSMMVAEKYVEPLKCKYGSAVADLAPADKAVKVPGRTPRESRQMMLYNLAVAIEARMAMLVDYVKREIKESGYEGKLPYGIVLTGGGAALENVDELFRRMTDLEIRIGKPMEGICDESLEDVDSTEYATVMGIMLRGMEQGFCTTGVNEPMDENMVVGPQSVAEEPIAKPPVVETPQPSRPAPTTPPVERVIPRPVVPQQPRVEPQIPTERIIEPQPVAEPRVVASPEVNIPPVQPRVTPEPMVTPRQRIVEEPIEEIENVKTFSNNIGGGQINEITEMDRLDERTKVVNRGGGWKSKVKSVFNIINDSFSSEEDEEI